MLGLGIMTRLRSLRGFMDEQIFELRRARLKAQRDALGGRKRVVVHVGLRKTGTTTIQAMLEANRHHLCPLFLRDDGGPIGPLREAGIAYSKAPGTRTLSRLRRAAATFDEILRAAPGDRAIVSDENLVGFAISDGKRDVFATAAEILGAIEEELSGHDVHFVLYTRDRGRWLRSCHNQDVKKHKCTDDFDAWLVRNGACRGWAEGCAEIRRTLVSELHVVQMEAELSGPGPLGRAVLEAAGYDDAAIATLSLPGPLNESLRAEQLEFMREVNALDLPFSVTSRIGDIVVRRPDLFPGKNRARA